MLCSSALNGNAEPAIFVVTAWKAAPKRKDADPDIPIYKQAKAEYAKLQ